MSIYIVKIYNNVSVLKENIFVKLHIDKHMFKYYEHIFSDSQNRILNQNRLDNFKAVLFNNWNS